MRLLLWIVSSVGAIQGCFAATDSYYTAAVLEHATFGSINDLVSEILDTNLAYYHNAIQIARSKNVDIIVFPEYGVFLPYRDRLRTKLFLETIPDPTEVDTTPCIDATHSQNPILRTLSCMARKNSMFVVANMGDIQNCVSDPDCPSDGVFLYNTNVVFDRNGKLLVRYHKENLFNEPEFYPGKKYQDTVFKTDFGTFATYICFDILFSRMADIVRYPNVDGVAYSSKWWNILPQSVSVDMFQYFALRHNVTFLGANIQLPGHYSVGSGIFHPREGALAYTFNPDGISKLVVSKVPRRDSASFSSNASITAVTETYSWEYVDDRGDISLLCSEKVLGHSSDNYTNYRCVESDTANYTLVKLTEPSGHLEACNNGMCCTLDYSADNMTENFYFGVLNATSFKVNMLDICEEICVLVRCIQFGDKHCYSLPLMSETVFHYVHLRGNFTGDLVYPSVIENKVRLPPLSEWTYGLTHNSSYNNQIVYSSQAGRKLITVGLKGSCFDRDPTVRPPPDVVISAANKASINAFYSVSITLVVYTILKFFLCRKD